ncbi:hypothetical protein BV20DRAFT_907090, partial [Pilatotrama ljubarskyi]
SKSWAALSREEKAEISRELVKDLDEVKEMKALSVQNVPLNAFHDACATLEAMFEELRCLHARTGLEVALVAGRSCRDQFFPPISFGTSARVYDFFPAFLNHTINDVACTFEAYCLSGVSGVIERSADVLLELQQKAASMIFEKLGHATNRPAKKMFYVGFAERITARYGLVIEHWPLPQFIAPAHIRSRIALLTLIKAWETDAAVFRSLSREEYFAW